MSGAYRNLGIRWRIVLPLALIAAAFATPSAIAEDGAALTPEQFEQCKGVYFNRCAGCHGLLRKGATGKNIEAARARELGTAALEKTLTEGTPAGMPAWGKEGILTADEIKLMARYLQMDAPQPVDFGMDKIRESWKLFVPVADRPTEPKTKRNWQNFFGVILRDVGQVAIIDGDTKEPAGIIKTGFAVHILRSSSTGRYFYAIGRDGMVSMIDLWTETPTLVAQVKAGIDARSVDASKFKGFEDRYVIAGCYWPPHYLVADGQTLEPIQLVGVAGATYDTNEELTEVRVASIIPSHFEPLWVVSLKESGHVALVDYSKEGFPIVAKIATERFLHDGGWDHTKRYFMVAANQRNQMVVVDVKEKKLVTKFETGAKPHPGRGANWEDPEFGWVNATTHIGEGRMVVYGADPEGKPEHAWKIVRELDLEQPGGLFIKTHPASEWVWMDSPLSNNPDGTRMIYVYSKKEGQIVKSWKASDRGRVVHFEYNQDGTEVWVSVWDKAGEIIVYDDKTLEEKTRIKGDWLVTPTGKFNVHNTANDRY